ncbi:hypothetical protein BHE74_00038714 [Ensete ventricosum]|nr:hypothetical protein BHE74_00038714 [Ensete ventricosum]
MAYCVCDAPTEVFQQWYQSQVFERKIGFKLRVMRLNRVESFYAFLLHFRSEGSPSKGQPGMAMASPLQGRSTTCKGVAGCGQAPYKGWPAAAKAPCKGATGCGQASCKGRPPVGAATRKWRPPAGAVVARGHDRLRLARKGLSPAARPQGATAHGAPAKGTLLTLRCSCCSPLLPHAVDPNSSTYHILLLLDRCRCFPLLLPAPSSSVATSAIFFGCYCCHLL